MRYPSKRHLKPAPPGGVVLRWIDAWNKGPRSFVGTKTAAQILESLAASCDRMNDSGHWAAIWIIVRRRLSGT